MNFKALLEEYKSLIGLVILIGIVGMLSPSFFTVANLLNVLRQTSINGVIAAGMTFVILTGGIDLSVGSILGFSGAVAASCLASGQSMLVTIILTLVIGSGVGLINGIIISKGKLQPFIVTLATMTILRGATLVFTDGKPISLGSGTSSIAFSKIGGGTIFGIPTPVVIMIFAFAICYYILTQTKMGRYTYALGGNEEATRLSGLNADRIKMFVYTISGLLASVAAIIITSRLFSAQPNAGDGYELDAIAAVVLGGTKLAGGKGKITGTIIGALIIGVLSNALNLLNVSSLSNPFFVDLKEGAEAKAKELGYELIVLDSQDDPAKEVSNMEDLTTKGVSLILLNPVDSDAATASVTIANGASIPVVTLDRNANGGEVVAHIASDNVEGGKMAGEFVVEKLNGEGSIVELEGIAGSSAARDRGQGFSEGIKGSNLNVVSKQTADFDRTKGLSVMENILQGNKDIKAVFAQNDEMALGAQKALEDAGLNDVLVVGFDATDDAVASVEEGKMAATIAQQPDLIGSLGIEAADKIIKGESLEAFIPVDLKLVTKGN